MQTTGDRADFPSGTAVSGGSTADLSVINGPFTEYDALMRERDALVCHRQMLERKRTQLEQSLQKQRSEKDVCPALIVFPSAEALLRATQSDRVQSTFSTHGITHQCVHNSAVLSSSSTPIDSRVGATGMKEYQKSFHAHYLEGTLRHAEKLSLCSANQDDVVRALATAHRSPMLRRLALDVPILSEAMVQYICQLETEGQLECVSLHLHQVTPALKLLCSLSSLRYLDVSHTNITTADLSSLLECPNLVNLDLSYCNGVTDVFPISYIKPLEAVNLSGWRQLVCVGALGRLPKLKELNVSETPITDLDLRELSKSRSLVKIDLHSCISLTCVNPLSYITTLEEINLSDCTALTRVGALGELPALKELYLSKTRITDEDVRHLSESRTLVKIDLHSCKSLTNVNPHSSIATLEVINLSDCTSLTHMGELGKLPALKELDFSGTPITDEDVRQLSESHTLVKIDLNSCKSLTCVNALSSITTLEVINLSDSTSLAHVGKLGRLPFLKEVDLSGTPITDEDVRQLSESHTLVKIDLHSCKSLTCVNALSSIATLKVINLSFCTSLTRVGELGKLPSLKEVYLRGTRITDDELHLLRECHTLLKIDLRYCDVLTNTTPLTSIATLEVINLSRCTSLTFVGELGKLPVLKEFCISYTRITDKDVRQLSSIKTLVKIDLQCCEALTNVNPLSSIATLEVINLSFCSSLTRVGELGMLPSLKELYLSAAPITDNEIRKLCQCHTLVKIDLRYCEALTNVNPLSSIATLEVINLTNCSSLTSVGELGMLPALKELSLRGTRIKDEDVRQLGESNTLVKMDLYYCTAPTNVNPLSSIATLEFLNLSRCYSLSDMGALGKLPVLKELNLCETRIMDDDVRQLSESNTLVKMDFHYCTALRNVNPLSSIATLEVINLSHCTSLTHVGELGKLPALKEVNLSATRIRDVDVRQLSESRTLVKIDLHSCEGLTNVNPLSSIATLEVINLSRCTSLTHVGELGKLPSLKEVDLGNTSIIDENVDSLCSLRQQLELSSINIRR